MNAIKSLKSLAIATIFSIAIPGLSIFSAANASTGISQNMQRSEGEYTSLINSGEYQVASALVNCRRVNTKGGRLYVRSSPGGRIVGALRDGTYVRIINRGSNGWVPVAAPVRGYVSGRYLTYCG
ncbi:MAG TPA: SH3 domain-containing protein [Leptolyngbyaceae cyanobacterium]